MTHTAEDFGPVLEGSGASDYERYIRTDELLSLQKPPDEQAHRDELLFQTVHQASELWLKLACFEVETATDLIGDDDFAGAVRLMRRAVLALRYVTSQLDMLEHMSPWEYQEVRKVLGHGSGFDSPGFNRIKVISPPLGEAFSAALKRTGIDLIELYQRGREFEQLYQLGELLMDWDERISLWRSHHFKMVERIIGGHVVGTQGTPVELLAHLHENMLFPAMWEARTTLTEVSKASETG
jgi:tryptophan 2,3-dioxygenase